MPGLVSEVLGFVCWSVGQTLVLTLLIKALPVWGTELFQAHLALHVFTVLVTLSAGSREG